MDDEAKNNEAMSKVDKGENESHERISYLFTKAIWK